MTNNKLSREQVLHIAKLANIKLTEKEIEQFKTQLTEIINYVQLLNILDTTKVSPTSQVTGLKNISRIDSEGKSISQKEALSQAKKTYKGYFQTEGIFNEA